VICIAGVGRAERVATAEFLCESGCGNLAISAQWKPELTLDDSSAK
jgi:hypothetical protein